MTTVVEASIIRAARDAEMVALINCLADLGRPNGMARHWLDAHRNGRFTYQMQQDFEALRNETYFPKETKK